VVDCNAKPAALVGHSKTTLAPERIVDSSGRLNASNPTLKLCGRIRARRDINALAGGTKHVEG
jgi:hypothetical protein